MVTRLCPVFASVTILMIAACVQPVSAARDVLRVGVFGVMLPGKVGLAKGIYAAENPDVQFLQVTGFVQQFEFLRDGKYDLIQTGSDNVVNYKLNPKNPLGAIMDVQLTDGLDLGMGLGLVAQRNSRRSNPCAARRSAWTPPSLASPTSSTRFSPSTASRRATRLPDRSHRRRVHPL